MNTTKKIALAAWAIAITGMLAELVAFWQMIPEFLLTFLQNAAGTLRAVNLTFFGMNVLEYFNYKAGLICNYCNLLFYFLMALGTFLYSFSGQKETRLLRFAFSVVLLSNAINFLTGFFIFFSEYPLPQSFGGWLQWVAARLLSAGLAYLSWWVLGQFARAAQLEVVREGEEVFLVKASKTRRAFNLAVDTVICLLILSLYSRMFGPTLWQHLETVIGQQGTLFILLIVFRLVYYPFFETLLGTTPAKILTRTRVVTTGGDKISFNDSFNRTLSRFVPFESFSFFGAEGWHDQWTGTVVVKETRQGVNGTRYLWIIPAVVVLALAGYFGYEKYEQHQRYLYAKAEHAHEAKGKERALAVLSTAHYVKLEDAQGRSSKDVYLKVEEIDQEKVVASVIAITQYDVTPPGVEQYYRVHQPVLNRVILHRDSLRYGFTPDYDAYQAYRRNTLRLPGEETEYEVGLVFRQLAPIIERPGGASLSNHSIGLSFENCGWPGTLTAIRNLEGSIAWQTELPLAIEGVGVKQYGCSSFTIVGSEYERNTSYAFELSVTDATGFVHKYLVEGVNTDRKISKMN